MESQPVSERQIKLCHHCCLKATNRAADALDWNRKDLSTISWDSLLSPLMALGSTLMRTKGASIRVLVSGHSVMLGWAPSKRFACITTAGFGLQEYALGLASVMT